MTAYTQSYHGHDIYRGHVNYHDHGSLSIRLPQEGHLSALPVAARVARGRSSWPQVGGDNDDHDDEEDDDGEVEMTVR